MGVYICRAPRHAEDRHGQYGTPPGSVSFRHPAFTEGANSLYCA